MSYLKKMFPSLRTQNLILSVEEETDLWRTLRFDPDPSACARAGDRLVTSHLPVCDKVAESWTRFGSRHLGPDLFKELIEETVKQVNGVKEAQGSAVQKGGFNPDKGRFCSYLENFALKAAACDFMMQNGGTLPIKTGKLNRYLFSNWGRLNDQVAHQAGPDITTGQRFLLIAGIAKKECKECRNTKINDLVVKIGLFAQLKNNHPLRVDSPVQQDEDSTFHDLFGDEQMAPETILSAVDTDRQFEAAMCVLKSMDPRSQEIVRTHVISGEKNLFDLAEQFGVSAERIRQIEVAALKKLRVEVPLQMTPRRKGEVARYIV